MLAKAAFACDVLSHVPSRWPYYGRTGVCWRKAAGEIMRAFLRSQLARHLLACEREQLRRRPAKGEGVEVHFAIESHRDDMPPIRAELG